MTDDPAIHLDRLVATPIVRRALAFLEADAEAALDWQIAVTAIPAPPFGEQVRAAFVQDAFKREGLNGTTLDAVGNVIGVLRGTGPGPVLVVSAHLDTVFPAGTNTRPVRRDGHVFAPGIADDGRGLAALWTLLRTLKACALPLSGDLVFCATVGEEGPGDLRGVKHLFQTRDDLDGFLSIEPGPPDRLTFQGIGSRRYRAIFQGPGGHSSSAFGTPSAIHALGRAIAGIADLQPPIAPKTTFTVGTVQGGTSVNTIAARAEMDIDMRSYEQAALAAFEATVLGVLKAAAAAENRRWQSDAILLTLERIGDRPCGNPSADTPMVQTAMAASRVLGMTPKLSPPGSTDCNVPIHLGIPAVTLGGGGEAANLHTLAERFNPRNAHLGPQRILLTLLGLAGIEGICFPLLPTAPRSARLAVKQRVDDGHDHQRKNR